MRWKPYPRYKASGVEWLWEVPEHWEAKSLGRMVGFAGGATPNKSKSEFWDGDIPWVSPKDMKRPRISDARDHISQEALSETSVSLILPRAVLIVVRGMILAHSFPVAIAGAPLTINQDMKALKAGREIEPEFLFLVLNGASRVFVSMADESAHGTRKLETEILKKVSIPVPPILEQRAIANFLDRKTTRIDRLVEKKRALIARLEEKRAALISRTVTRGLPLDAATQVGLDPRPNLQPSGIDWLGEVPEHWGVVRFRTLLCRLDQGRSPVASSWPAAEGEWGVLKLSAARAGAFIPEENKALEEDFDPKGAPTPRAGDLLISRSNTPDRVGDVGLVRGDYPRLLIPDLLYRAQLLQHKAMPDFLCWFLLSRGARAQIEADARGSSGSMVKLGQGHIGGWLIPYPPLPEQRAIAAFLDRETVTIDQMAAKIEAAIERLQEYRTALITAAVTGKIDVRELGEPRAETGDRVSDIVGPAATGGTSSDAGHTGERA